MGELLFKDNHVLMADRGERNVSLNVAIMRRATGFRKV